MKSVFAFLALTVFLINTVYSYEVQYGCLLEGEEYLKCGTACPRTCIKPNVQACTLQCTEGCFCREGLFRDTFSGRCVTDEECQRIITSENSYLP